MCNSVIIARLKEVMDRAEYSDQHGIWMINEDRIQEIIDEFEVKE